MAGCLMALLVAACGGGDPDGSAPPADTLTSTVTGADGARIDFTGGRQCMGARPHPGQGDALRRGA
jgi:hypothetical protein